MLFGEDIYAKTEDLPAVLNFQHKLLQEYLAAFYITGHSKLGTFSQFLMEAFPTWEIIQTHIEVVKFACGIFAKTDATIVANHVAKVLCQHVQNELNDGKQIHESNILYEAHNKNKLHGMSILQSCQKEGGIPALNPYINEYPSLGYPLAEVLANSELVYIHDIDENDTLQLIPSPAKIILNLRRVDLGMYDKLWQGLQEISANIISLHLSDIQSSNVTKLHHFPQLKYLRISDCRCSEGAMEDLAESIDSWGPQQKLKHCNLSMLPIPRSVMIALCKCIHLIQLSFDLCNLFDKLDVLMASPPPALKHLQMQDGFLGGADVEHITQAIKHGRLTSLQELDIKWNPVGEVAVGHLLETLISTRPHTQLKLWLWHTGVNEYGMYTYLSEQFVTEWKRKLANTNIRPWSVDL